MPEPSPEFLFPGGGALTFIARCDVLAPCHTRPIWFRVLLASLRNDEGKKRRFLRPGYVGSGATNSSPKQYPLRWRTTAIIRK